MPLKLAPADWDSLFAELTPRGGSAIDRPREAVLRECRRRLARNQADTEARKFIAAADLQAGNPTGALQLLQQAGDLLEDDAASNRLAGYASLANSQPDAAKAFFSRALKISPHQPDAWAWLGRIHEQADDPDQAIQYYQRGFYFDDFRYDSTIALVKLLAKRRLRGEAIVTLRRALQRDRRSPVLNSQLSRQLRHRAAGVLRQGNARQHQQMLREARRCLRIAIAARPTVAEWMSLGSIAEQLEEFSEARSAYANALAIRPGHSAAATKLATLLIDDGEIERAADQLRGVLRKNPAHAEAHFRYSRIRKCKRGAETDDLIVRLRKLIANSNRRQDEVQLRFALAKILDDIGDFDQAWTQYDTANRSKPGHSTTSDRPPCVARFRDQIEQRIAVADRVFFEQRSDWGCPEAKPIFIIGMPRSGTTLTEQVISSHDRIFGAGELKYVEQLRKQICFDHGREIGAGSEQQQRSLGEIPRSYVHSAAETYLDWTTAGRDQALRIVDKMPTNFLNLDLISIMFPGATIIHCRRDPMDVLISSYCQNLNAPFCDLSALTEYYRDYRRLMRYWETTLPVPIHTVDYEQLVSDPEPVVRNLLEACDVEWEPRCLEFHRNSRAVRTPSKWQVRQPLYQSSIGKWKRFEPFLIEEHRKVRAIVAEFDTGINSTSNTASPATF